MAQISQYHLYRHIGEAVKRLRFEKGWTQDRLAEELGLTRVSITNLEAGRQRTPVHVLYEIFQIFDKEPIKCLPTIEEIDAPVLVEVEIGGVVKRVPAKSVEFVKSLAADPNAAAHLKTLLD